MKNKWWNDYLNLEQTRPGQYSEDENISLDQLHGLTECQLMIWSHESIASSMISGNPYDHSFLIGTWEFQPRRLRHVQDQESSLLPLSDVKTSEWNETKMKLTKLH